MTGTIFSPLTFFEESIPTRGDGASNHKMQPNASCSAGATVLLLLKGARRPRVPPFLVAESTFRINLSRHSIWIKQHNYLAAIARRVLLRIGFCPQAPLNTLLLQEVDWIILNRRVGKALQPAVACSNKFAHHAIQEVHTMR